MSKARSILLLCLVAVLAVSAAAQQQEASNIGWYYQLAPKAGHESQLEQGIKRHRQWHRDNGDQSVWLVWQIANGPEMGQFFVGNVGQSWKDFDAQDALGEKHAADVATNITTHVEKVTSELWAFEPELSLQTEAGPPAKLLQIVDFRMKPEKVAGFRRLIQEVNEAIKKVEPEGRRSRWYSLISGDTGPRLALVQERDTWADFAGTGRSLFQLLTEAYGEERARTMLQQGGESYWGTDTVIFRYRPDLSGDQQSGMN